MGAVDGALLEERRRRLPRRGPLPDPLLEPGLVGVEVVNGGNGLRRTCRLSISATVKPDARRIASAAARALASLSRSKRSRRLPSRWVSRAVKVWPASVLNSTSMVQYSRDLNTSISDSRSQTKRNATDWTRPAERLPGSLRHSTGDNVKPTR